MARPPHRRAGGRRRASHRRPRARSVDEHRQPVARRARGCSICSRAPARSGFEALSRGAERRAISSSVHPRAWPPLRANADLLGAGRGGGHSSRPTRCDSSMRCRRTPTTWRSPIRRTISESRRRSPSGGWPCRSPTCSGRRASRSPRRCPVQATGDDTAERRSRSFGARVTEVGRSTRWRRRRCDDVVWLRSSDRS